MATEATCNSTVIDNTEKSPHLLSLIHIMLFIKFTLQKKDLVIFYV